MADENKSDSTKPDADDDTIVDLSPEKLGKSTVSGVSTMPMFTVGQKGELGEATEQKIVIIEAKSAVDDVQDITMSDLEFVEDEPKVVAPPGKPSSPPPAPPKPPPATKTLSGAAPPPPPPPKGEASSKVPLPPKGEASSKVPLPPKGEASSKVPLPPPKGEASSKVPLPPPKGEPSSKVPLSSATMPMGTVPLPEATPLGRPPTAVSGSTASPPPSGSTSSPPPKFAHFPTLPAFSRDELGEAGNLEKAKAAGSLKPSKFPTLPPLASQDLLPPPPTLEEDAQQLVELINAELEGDLDLLRAARLHYELATTCEHHLKDLARAARHYQRAAKLWPEHKPSLHGARRTLLALDRAREVLPLFDAEVRVTKEPKRRAALLYAKAHLLETELKMSHEARTVYREALELDANDVTILKALWRCERRHEDWAALAGVYEDLANAVAGDPEYQSALIAGRAHLAEVYEQDPVKAAELYEKALELDPRAPGAIAALKRLCHARGRWNELVSVLHKELALASDASVRVDDLQGVARLLKEKLGDTSTAITALESAVAEAPHDAILLGRLTDLYAAAGRQESLAKALERLDRLIDAPSEKLLLAHRIGQIYEALLSDDGAARRWYETALAIDPSFRPALDGLGSLYERVGDWAAMIRMLQRQAESSNDEQERAVAHARMAEIYELRLGRAEQAAEHYDRALGLVPSHESSLKALTRLHAQAGRFRELAELYQRVVDRSPGEDRAIAYLFRIGSIYEDQLNEPAGAVHAYRRILEIDSQHLGAIQAVQRAAERAGEHEVLLEMLEREVTLARRVETKVALLCRAAEVCDVHLKDLDAAVLRLGRVLQLDSGNVVALGMLARIQRRAGRWDELLKTYQMELQHAQMGVERARLIHKIGELCETRLGREKDAISHYRQALTIDAGHGPSYDALSRLLAQREQWADLARLMEQRLPRLQTPEERCSLCLEIGRIYEERMKNNADALAFYERALDEVPGALPAFEGRTRLLHGSGKWKPLAENLAVEAELAPDDTIAINARLEEGLLHAHRLNDKARATNSFEWILERAPGHRGALLGLEELHLTDDHPEALAEVHRRQAAALVDVSARVAALRELARLQGISGLEKEARQSLHSLLELKENDEGALEVLARLAARWGDQSGEVGYVSRLVKASDDRELTGYRLGKVAVLLEQQGDPMVLVSYRAALAMDPDCLVTTRGFTRAARRSGDPEAIREAALREAKVTHDVPLAVTLLKQSATLRRLRGELEGAVVDLEKALDLEPGDVEAADQLKAVLLQLNQIPRLVELLSRAAEAVKDKPRSAALHLEAAGLVSSRLRNLPAAVAAARRALVEVPGYVPALVRLAADLEANEQWQEAAEALGKVVELSRDESVLVDAHLRLAAIADERLGEPSRALPSLRAVLKRDEQNSRALARLARLEAARGKHEEALTLSRKLFEASTGDGERAAALVQVAAVEKICGRAKEEAQALAEAIAYEGAEGVSARLYAALIEEGSEEASWEVALTSLAKFIDRASRSGAATSSSHRAVATILTDHLGRPAEALTSLRRGLEGAPADVGMRLKLARLLQARGENEQAISEVRTLLRHDVTQPEAWRALSRSLAAIGDEREASAAVQPLRVLDAAAAEELVEVMSRKPRMLEPPMGFLTAQEFVDLQVDPAHEPTTTLIAALSPAFAKLYPADPGRYGLARRDRLPARGLSPLRAVADQVAAVVGVPAFELYLHQQGEQDVAVELGKPSSLFLPEWTGDLSEPALIFLIARPMITIAQELQTLYRVPLEELALLLAGACQQVAPGFGSKLAREAVLEEKSRLVTKPLPRKTRKSLGALTERYVAAPSDLEEWAAAVHQASSRAALLLADDIVSAIEVIEQTTGESVDSDGTAADLLRFWASPAAARFRRAQG